MAPIFCAKKEIIPPAIIRGNTVSTVDPRFTDTHLIPTPHYYGQFSLSQFNLLNTDTLLVRTMDTSFCQIQSTLS